MAKNVATGHSFNRSVNRSTPGISLHKGTITNAITRSNASRTQINQGGPATKPPLASRS